MPHVSRFLVKKKRGKAARSVSTEKNLKKVSGVLLFKKNHSENHLKIRESVPGVRDPQSRLKPKVKNPSRRKSHKRERVINASFLISRIIKPFSFKKSKFLSWTGDGINHFLLIVGRGWKVALNMFYGVFRRGIVGKPNGANTSYKFIDYSNDASLEGLAYAAKRNRIRFSTFSDLRLFFDSLRSSRANSHLYAGDKSHTIHNRKKGQRLSKKSIVVALSVALVFTIATALTFQKFTGVKAQVALFYPTVCLGEWKNPDNATGSPDVTDGDIKKYSDANSASVSNVIASIFCGAFDGELMADATHHKVSLKFSWVQKNAGAETELRAFSESLDDAIGDRVDDANEQRNGADDGNNENKESGEAANADGDKETTEYNEPNTEDEHNAQEAKKRKQEIIVKGRQITPEEISLRHHALERIFFPTALARESGGLSEEQTLNDKEPAANKGPSSEAILEALYTIDGNTWNSLGYVFDVHNDVSFEMPIDEFETIEDLKRAQISIRSLALTFDDPPTIYLDAMWLEVEYRLPTPSPEVSLQERIKRLEKRAIKGSDVIRQPEGKTSFKIGEEPFFEINEAIASQDNADDANDSGGDVNDKDDGTDADSKDSANGGAGDDGDDENNAAGSEEGGEMGSGGSGEKEMEGEDGEDGDVEEGEAEESEAGSGLDSRESDSDGGEDSTEPLGGEISLPQKSFLEASLAYLKKMGEIFKIKINFALADSKSKSKFKGEIYAELYYPDGKLADIKPIIKRATNKTTVKIPAQKNSFKPGRYRLKVYFVKDKEVLVAAQDFTWGVLAVNFNKSVYESGEKAYVQMGVLTNRGNTICDANLELKVTLPNGDAVSLTTDGGGIVRNSTCGYNNVTDEPDYYTHLMLKSIGVFGLRLTNLDNGYFIEDSIEVKGELPLNIERIGATRINPFRSEYTMTLKVTAKDDFKGELSEQFPGDFKIIEGKTKWEINLKAGQSQTFQYTYLAPRISPAVFLLGPAKISPRHPVSGQTPGVWEEARRWQLASDADTVVIITSNTPPSGYECDTPASGCFKLPSDWSSFNTIEVIGGGGSGGNVRNISGGRATGGGGGAYSVVSDITSLSPGDEVVFQVGAGGASVVNSSTDASTAGNPGTDTFFNRTSGTSDTCADTSSVCAKAGQGGNAGTGMQQGGSGGNKVNNIPANAGNSGGSGGRGSHDNTSTGGGGAAGATDNGGDGTTTSTDNSATDGGAGNGTGAAGGAGSAGTGARTGDNGSDGTEWTTAGSGGGGGGARSTDGNNATGGSGGSYGAGGGGANSDGGTVTSGDGKGGVIVITYTPLSALYWVGGSSTVNWDSTDGCSSTTCWSTESGGSPGASIPTSDDDVFFDGNSGNGVAVVNTNFTVKTINTTGYTGTIRLDANLTATLVTLAGGTINPNATSILTSTSTASDLTFGMAITKSSGSDSTLTIRSGRSIIVNQAISSSSNKLHLVLNADRAANTSGHINIAAPITTNGGDITMGGGSGTISAGSGFAVGNVGQAVGILINNVDVNAGGGNIIVNGQGFDAATNNNHGVYITGASAKLRTEGTGTLTITGVGKGTTDSGSNMGAQIDAGGIVSTVNGLLTVNGTGGGAGSGASNHGVFVTGTNSTIRTTGSGNIEITGQGGNPTGSGAANYGVYSGIANGIQTTGTGNITIVGTGGHTSGTGADNDGVRVDAANGIRTSGSAGNITITGTGGVTSSGTNIGVRVTTPGTITACSNCNISITGTGGNGSGNSNDGIFITGASAAITATGTGTITLTGIGKGITNSGTNRGVFVSSGATVSTENGLLTVDGTGGGAGSGVNNFGVRIFNTNSTIRTTGSGNIEITGQGGNPSGSGASNLGVVLETASGIQTTGTGNITIVGTGGNNSSGSGNGNIGVAVDINASITACENCHIDITGTGGNSSGNSNVGIIIGTSSTVTTTGTGTITLTGIGKGITNSGFNRGVSVSSGSTVSTENGLLTVDGTGGGAGSGASNHGVFVAGTNSTIRTTGSGNLDITGQGGNPTGSGATNHGVYSNIASGIQTTGTGNITIVGTGGHTSGTGADNDGVRVDAANGIRTSGSAGNITITGTGGVTSSGTNIGVRVTTPGTITACSNCNISITGTGGNGSGNSNDGIFITGASAAITATGTGTITLTGIGKGTTDSSTSRGVNIESGGIVSTVNGLLTVNGTGGGAGSGINNHGVRIVNTNSTIRTTGSGNIEITGQGGNPTGSGGANWGVYSGIANGIQTTGTGNITIVGTGGHTSGTGADNDGVRVDAANGIRTSGSAGNITITGTGGVTSSGTNIGVRVTTPGTITACSNCNISITGTGGNGSGNSNDGIFITGASAAITATGTGTITLTGIGKGITNSGLNRGVNVAAGGIVSTVNGLLTVNGTGGGAGSGASNHGVLVTGTNSTIRTTGSGNIEITGQGGNPTGSGATNHGVYSNIASGIQTTGTGNITIEGTGGHTSGTGANNDGVRVDAANGIRTSGSAGNITITGTGGVTSSGTNIGVRVTTPGTITACSNCNISITGTGGNGSGSSNHGIFVTGASAAITATGTGTITLTGIGKGTTNSSTSRGVNIESGGIVSTVNGLLTVNGTGGGAGSGASNHGVFVTGTNSTIRTTGSGNLDITGQGGNPTGSGATNHGVYSNIASGIQTTGTGNITIEGTGGHTSGTGANNDGVRVDAANGIRTSGSAGNITITGTGGVTSSGTNIGVRVTTPGTITACSNCNISITGTGGNGSGSSNHGIFVTGASAAITATGTGTITLTGIGKGTTNSSTSRGVNIESGGIVSTVNGLLTVNGTGGGAGSGASNHGVFVIDANAAIKTTGSGNISVTGERGNDASTSYGVNVAVANGIQTEGTGSITVATNTILTAEANDINSAADLTMKPKTASATIGVGAGAGTLALTDTVLGHINWVETLTIGATNAGNITINTSSAILNKNVTFLTGGNITLETTALAHAGGSAATLQMQAHGNITINSAITAADSALTIVLHSDFDDDASGTIAINAAVNSNGGPIAIQGGGGSINTANAFDNLTINTGTNTITLGANFTTDDYLTISSGVFDVTASGCSSASCAVNIAGDYTNSGTFTARTGTVTLNGTAQQTLSGALVGTSAFYNLVITNDSGTDASDNNRTDFVPGIIFADSATATNNYIVNTPSVRVEYVATKTYTFANIDWDGGGSGNRIFFRSSEDDDHWLLKVTGTQSVSYVNVSWSDASVAGGDTIDASNGTNYDGENNINWNFGSALFFAISDNSVSFGTLSQFSSRFATTGGGSDTDSSDAHTLTVSSGAPGGYVISVDGTTLTKGSDTINVIGATAASPAPGTKQFGIRLVVNSGNGSVASPYNEAAKFALDIASSSSQVASGAGDGVVTEFGVRYLCSVSADTAFGNYTANLSYLITATY